MTKKNKAIFVGTRLTPEIYEQLKAYAESDDRSVSYCLKRAVEKLLAESAASRAADVSRSFMGPG